MKFICISLIALVSVVAASSPHSFDVQADILESEWNEFKRKFNKTYENDTENNLRQKYYIDNRNKIMKHNSIFYIKNENTEKSSFVLGLNEYADMPSYEFISTMNGYNAGLRKTNGSVYIRSHNIALPVELNWEEKGYVTEVKNQGRCGSCWAFSATGALEGQTKRKFKKLVSLSEQNLIDCSRDYDNNGCNGGRMDNSFRYIKDNHGIDTESTYLYEAEEGECRYKPENKGAEDFGFVNIPSNDEDCLLEALATKGPISVAIDASLTSFQLYESGIYDDPKCSTKKINHAVLLVGYGVEGPNDKKYWLVKNSWGKSWGKDGYIKITRGKNQCGIAKEALYPIV